MEISYTVCSDLRDDLQQSVDALAALDTMLLSLLENSELKRRANGIHLLMRQQIDELAVLQEVAEGIASAALQAEGTEVAE
jgi:hypothetical protein